MSHSTENTVGRFVVNALSSVLTTLVSMTVLVWVNQYLLRRIPAEEYSLIPIVTTLMIFAELFQSIASGGLARFMVEAHAKGDDAGVARVVSSMLPVLVLTAFIVASAGALAVWRIEDIIRIDTTYTDDARIMLGILVAVLCLNILTTPFTAGLYVRMRFTRLNLIKLACEVLRVAVLLVLLLGVSTQAMWLIVATAISGVVSVALLFWQSRRLLPAARFRRELMSLSMVRRLTGFGAWGSLHGVTLLLQRTLPVLMLNQYATAVDVSAFHLGNQADTQIRRLTNAVAVPAQPALIGIYATEGAGALTDFYYRGGRYFLWFTLFLPPPLVAFAHPLIALYVGETYAQAADVLVWIIGAYPFVWASAMFYQVAYAIGRIGLFHVCNAAMVAVSLVALLVAVGPLGLGAAGAGMALGGSFAAMHVLLIWPMGLRLVNGNWRAFLRRTLVPGLLPFAGAMTAGLAFRARVAIDDWGAFAAGCALSAAVYGAVVLAISIGGEDRELLSRLRARVLGRLRPLAPGE